MVNETRKEKSNAFAWGGVGVFSREWIFSTFVFTVPHNGRWLCLYFLNITQSKEITPFGKREKFSEMISTALPQILHWQW